MEIITLLTLKQGIAINYLRQYKMKEFLNNYRSNIPIILLIIYALGYTFLNRYFSRFDISIEHYVNLTDILFFTISSLIELSILFLVIEAILWVLTFFILIGYYKFRQRKFLSKIDRKTVYGEKLYDRYYSLKVDHPFDLYFKDATVIVFFFGALATFFITKEYLLVASISLPFIVVKIYSHSRRNDMKHNKKLKDKKAQKKSQEKSLLYLGVLSIVLIFFFGVWGHKSGNRVKSSGFYSKPIEFCQDSVLYSTVNSSFNFIGETSSYIFLYNYSVKKTYAFNKESITQLRIVDPAIREIELWRQGEKQGEEWSKNLKNFFKKN